MSLGGPEILIIVIVAVVLFGAGWLPKAAKNLGKAKVEFDNVQQQFNQTKDSVVEATGVKELEATITKANKVLKTSPQQLMKDAAKSTAAGSSVAKTSDDDDIEDAEIVEPSTAAKSPAGETNTPAPTATDAADEGDTNINLDFS